VALYDRIIGIDADNPKIPVHAFAALMGEFARSRITGQQAQAGVELTSGAPLAAGEITEAQALLATVTGTATARLLRAKEIEDVLMLAENGIAGYTTSDEIKLRLGV
jgi:hypothetical protein